MCTPELLAELRNQIIDNAYRLHEALVVAGGVETAYTQLPAALKQCLGYVQSVSDTAARAKLTGLQQICILTNRNVLQLHALDEKAGVCAELEQWPGLVMNYLRAPRNEEARQKLIHHLQSPQWSDPLSDQKATMLLGQLSADYEAQLAEAFSSESAMTQEVVFSSLDTEPALAEAALEESAIGEENDKNLIVDEDFLAHSDDDFPSLDEESTSLLADEIEGELDLDAADLDDMAMEIPSISDDFDEEEILSPQPDVDLDSASWEASESEAYSPESTRENRETEDALDSLLLDESEAPQPDMDSTLSAEEESTPFFNLEDVEEIISPHSAMAMEETEHPEPVADANLDEWDDLTSEESLEPFMEESVIAESPTQPVSEQAMATEEPPVAAMADEVEDEWDSLLDEDLESALDQSLLDVAEFTPEQALANEPEFQESEAQELGEFPEMATGDELEAIADDLAELAEDLNLDSLAESELEDLGEIEEISPSEEADEEARVDTRLAPSEMSAGENSPEIDMLAEEDLPDVMFEDELDAALPSDAELEVEDALLADIPDFASEGDTLPESMDLELDALLDASDEPTALEAELADLEDAEFTDLASSELAAGELDGEEETAASIAETMDGDDPWSEPDSPQALTAMMADLDTESMETDLDTLNAEGMDEITPLLDQTDIPLLDGELAEADEALDSLPDAFLDEDIPSLPEASDDDAILAENIPSAMEDETGLSTSDTETLSDELSALDPLSDSESMKTEFDAFADAEVLSDEALPAWTEAESSLLDSESMNREFDTLDDSEGEAVSVEALPELAEAEDALLDSQVVEAEVVRVTLADSDMEPPRDEALPALTEADDASLVDSESMESDMDSLADAGREERSTEGLLDLAETEDSLLGSDPMDAEIDTLVDADVEAPGDEELPELSEIEDSILGSDPMDEEIDALVDADVEALSGEELSELAGSEESLLDPEPMDAEVETLVDADLEALNDEDLPVLTETEASRLDSNSMEMEFNALADVDAVALSDEELSDLTENHALADEISEDSLAFDADISQDSETVAREVETLDDELRNVSGMEAGLLTPEMELDSNLAEIGEGTDAVMEEPIATELSEISNETVEDVDEFNALPEVDGLMEADDQANEWGLPDEEAALLSDSLEEEEMSGSLDEIADLDGLAELEDHGLTDRLDEAELPAFPGEPATEASGDTATLGALVDDLLPEDIDGESDPTITDETLPEEEIFNEESLSAVTEIEDFLSDSEPVAAEIASEEMPEVDDLSRSAEQPSAVAEETFPEAEDGEDLPALDDDLDAFASEDELDDALPASDDALVDVNESMTMDENAGLEDAESSPLALHEDDLSESEESQLVDELSETLLEDNAALARDEALDQEVMESAESLTDLEDEPALADDLGDDFALASDDALEDTLPAEDEFLTDEALTETSLDDEITDTDEAFLEESPAELLEDGVDALVLDDELADSALDEMDVGAFAAEDSFATEVPGDAEEEIRVASDGEWTDTDAMLASEVDDWSKENEDTLETLPEEPLLDADDFSAERSDAEAGIPPLMREKLTGLASVMADMAAPMSGTVRELIEAEDESELLLDATGRYVELLQPLWDSARESDLAGLNQCCEFLNENVMAMAMQGRTERAGCGEVLSNTPDLLMDYLLAPEEGAQPLVEHLQSGQWPQPLDESQGQDFLDRLNFRAQASRIPEESSGSDDALLAETENESESALAEDESAWRMPQSVADQLTEALGQAAEPMSVALETLTGAADESEDLLTAISDYTEAFQPFWSAVDEAEAAPLSDLCGFVNENLMAAGMLPGAERARMQPLLEMWPGLMLDYLLAPEESAADLLDHVTQDGWAMPLADELRDFLVERLPALRWVEDSADFADSAPETLRPEASTQDAEEDPVELIPAAVAEAITGALMTAMESLPEIHANLLGADNDSEELLGAVDAFAETMQPLWDTAESAELSGILEVCTLMNENVMALTMQPRAERQAMAELLEIWPGTLLDYVLAPEEGVDEILETLQNGQWPAALSADDAAKLRTQLLAPATSGGSAPTPANIHLGDPGTVEMLQATLVDSTESLSTALETIVSMDNTNESFLEAVETYTNHVQAIHETAEMAGLVGLQEACSFVNDNLMALSAEDGDRRQAAQPVLAAWPDHLLGYLANPVANTEILVTALQDPAWAVPLDATQAQALRDKLLQGSVSGGEAVMPEEAAEVAPEPVDEEVVEAEPPTPMDAGSGDISLGNAEMIEMLRGELDEIQGELAEHLEPFVTMSESDPGFADVAENYTDGVGRVAAVMEMMNLEGLQEVCNIIIENVTQLATQDQAARAKVKQPLEQWPRLILEYLEAPRDHVIALLNHFREDHWPARLADERAHQLLNALTQSVSGPEMEEDPEDSRETVAKSEDVYLAVPQDANQEMLEAYFTEAPQNATELNQVIQRIVQDPNPEDVKLAQRTAHTLKGSSNIIGIKGVANLAHHMEDIMEYLYENAVVPPKPLADTLVEAADTLEMMINFLLGQEDAPENALGVLQDVLNWANRVDKGELEISEEELKKQNEARAAAQQRAAQQPQPKPQAAAAGGAAGPEVSTEQTLRVPTRTVDDLMRLIGEMSISIGQIQERLKHLIVSTKTLNDQDLLMQQKGFELETLVTVRDVTGRKRHRQLDKEEQQQDHDFDSLEFEQYNELHSVTHSFIETIADSRELGGTILDDLNALDTIFVQQERLNKEFQQIIMSTRMEPIRTIANRLERIVRQTCRATSKQAELQVVGGDILMDGEVLTKLTDPLLHILRNSIDHGMETPEERIAAGKPESGTVTLRAFRKGNNIIVRCEDDGKGLNYEKIRSICIERELLKEGQEISDKELGRMIFIPGFSTKNEVTQVSGRGVGMDVVHTSIQQLKGSVDIESTPGQGTSIILSLPMSLVTEHVLLVKIGPQQFAIPTSYLEQALTPDAGEFRKVGNNISFHMDKQAYPATTLAKLLNLPSEIDGVQENETRPLVLVREETSTTAVIVDELLDSRDLVAKNMGNYVKQIKGVAGASILGDGSVVVMLNLPSLLRTPARSLGPLPSAASGGTAGAADFGIPHVLIVDDSLSVRKSLTVLVEDAGFEPLLAKDGLEAIEVVGQNKPKVMLVDMEMPRMNGIELTEHIRANDQTKDIPIFMITSRTTEKHRELARNAGVSAYLTKPYPEEELVKMLNDAING